eukprot:6214811-Pleurochrysis_carterae.AAC.3
MCRGRAHLERRERVAQRWGQSGHPLEGRDAAALRDAACERGRCQHGVRDPLHTLERQLVDLGKHRAVGMERGKVIFTACRIGLLLTAENATQAPE